MLLETGNYFAVARSKAGAHFLGVGLTQSKGALAVWVHPGVITASKSNKATADEYAFSTSFQCRCRHPRLQARRKTHDDVT